VQQVELTREVNDADFVEILEPVKTGRSIVKQADEIKLGDTVLRAGEEINAAMIATLASFGYAQVKVGRRPRVSVMATGSELVDVGHKPGRDQIRDSNNYTIAAYASLAGATVERLPLVGDDTEELKRQIARATAASDMLITSGGVSMGVYDFTKAALKELGAEIFSNEWPCGLEANRLRATRRCAGVWLAGQSGLGGRDVQSVCADCAASDARRERIDATRRHRGARSRPKAIDRSRELSARYFAN